MNSFPHHISTPSRPPNIDFPKIVDFTNKEISRKWCSNSEMIEKARLLQESITHPKTDFELVANKKLTFNCSINDAGATIFLRWEKSNKYCTHCLRAKLRFWELRTPFLRKNDWQQIILIKLIGIKLIWKDVEWRTKTANTVTTVFEQKFAFESSGLHFWENNWLTSNNKDQIDWKRCWVTNKNSKCCTQCLRAKLCFWELQASFLRKWLFNIKR